MITLSHVTKTFGSKVAVNDITTTIPSGAITGFIGPNGAGKTTTISMICGILKPDQGEIRLNDKPIQKDSIAAKKEFAYIPDTPDLFLRLSGFEYIQFLADLYEIPQNERKERIERYAREFEMENDLSLAMKSCSHGMRQKILVIASLVCDRPIWILDEPMTGLDPTSSWLLKEKMKEQAAQGKTIFFSTHVLEVAEKLCDKILLIDSGKIYFDGTLDELKSRYPGLSLEEIYLSLTRNPQNAALDKEIEESLEGPSAQKE